MNAPSFSSGNMRVMDIDLRYLILFRIWFPYIFISGAMYIWNIMVDGYVHKSVHKEIFIGYFLALTLLRGRL